MTGFLLGRNVDRERTLKRIAAFLELLPKGKAWEVRASLYRTTRSQKQNAYLHGVAYKLLSDHTGYELEEIAELLCGEYFGWKRRRCPRTPTNRAGWKSVPIRTTTRNAEGKRDVLNKADFADYVAFVQRFAAEKAGVVIPDPDPDYLLHRQRKAAA